MSMTKIVDPWMRACAHFGYERLTEAEIVGRVNSVTRTMVFEKDRFRGNDPEIIKLSKEMFNWFWRIGEQDPDLVECRWVILTRVPLKEKQMAKKIEQDWDAVYTDAVSAANTAQVEYMRKYGEPMYCGFAWVNVPGTHPFTKWLKDNHPRAGRQGHPKGWDIWSPGAYNGQSMDIKEMGARAFAAVLKEYDIPNYVGSRPD